MLRECKLWPAPFVRTESDASLSAREKIARLQNELVYRIRLTQPHVEITHCLSRIGGQSLITLAAPTKPTENPCLPVLPDRENPEMHALHADLLINVPDFYHLGGGGERGQIYLVKAHLFSMAVLVSIYEIFLRLPREQLERSFLALRPFVISTQPTE